MTDILPHERSVCFRIIRHILAEQNGDDVDAARNIAASIRSNPVLEDVSVESLEVHDDVWDMLLDAVFHNQHVKRLDVAMPVDVKKLARDIRQMSGLKELIIAPAMVCFTMLMWTALLVCSDQTGTFNGFSSLAQRPAAIQ